MGYNSETDTYDLTRWPGPVDGILLPPGEKWLSYNYIKFELLKPSLSPADNLSFWQSNGNAYPSSLEFDSYFNFLEPRIGTMVLKQNGRVLEQNVSYRYSPSQKRFRLIYLVPAPGDNDIGILHCEYIPAELELLYQDIPLNRRKAEGVVIERRFTPFVMEIVDELRRGVDNLWKFMKAVPPLFTGGEENQSRGFNNLIKYVTPISVTHYRELARELDLINGLMNLRFSRSISLTIPETIETTDLLGEELLGSLMLALNQLEEQMDAILTIPSNREFLNV